MRSSRGAPSSLIESPRSSHERSNTIASIFNIGDGLGGGKTIGWVGSLCLLVNNITGPAMLSIGTVFAQAGWVPSVLLFVLCGVLACFASVFLRIAIESLGSNIGFARRVEITDAIKERHIPRWAFSCSLWGFILLFIASNVSSIVESAQTMDQLFVNYAGKSCALGVYPPCGFYCVLSDSDDSEGKECTTAASSSDSPFGSSWVISLGFLATMTVVIPLSFLNLDDNIMVQNASFLCLAAIVFEWCYQFVGLGLTRDEPPAVGKSFSNLFGNVLFNFAFILTIPSWLNEKKPEVDVNETVTWSVWLSVLMFVVLGYTAASVYPSEFRDSNDDLLTVILDGDSGATAFTRTCAYIFPPVVLWSGIPVFSIIVRYNLLQEGLCGPRAANFIAVVSPWIFSLLLYSGTLLNSLMNWTGLLVVVPLNFILPCYLYLKSRSTEQDTRMLSARSELENPLNGPSLTTPAENTECLDGSWYFGVNLERHGVLVARLIIVVTTILNVVAIVYAF